MKLYDIVKQLLENYPETRDSDKKLIWDVYNALGYVKEGKLDYYDFILPECPPTESIRRCRQKIQETHPNLQASIVIQKERKKKELSKSMFVYHEKASGRWDFSSGTAQWIE